MDSKLENSIVKICDTLNKHNVQYMIVGGTAVALHGYFRHSLNLAGIITEKPDLDFWYNPTYGNYFNLLNALEGLGQNVTEFKLEQAPDPERSFFKYELETFTLDLLPEIKARLSFKASFKTREIVSLQDTDIPFISYDDLIKDKEANARPKDLLDIEHLKKNRPGE